MIARTWHGRVPADKTEAYHRYLLETGLADFRATPGNRGAQVLRRTEGDVTHYFLVSFWDSIESVKSFAGSDYEVARYYPADDAYLLEREPYVTHYEMVAAGQATPIVGAETRRIADLLFRAFAGDAWIGRSIREIVAEFTPEQAAAHLVPGFGSVWEILGHIATWLETARIRLSGRAHVPSDEENFPAPKAVSAEAWAALWRRVEEQYRGLAVEIEALPDERLQDRVPGKDYPVYELLHGIVQHSLYHAGQLAVLARAARATAAPATAAGG